LDSTDVNLTGIGAVKVPTFVVNSCRRILEEVATIGIFRKTGSASRQKEIIFRLERGQPFEESDNVIDIACILKTFFRSLPEPLIPPGNIQETFIRCLLDDSTVKPCVLLACLLLPPLVLNTLAYFCQFLAQVARYADTNKMTVSNLAIILAPNIMPVHHNIQQRHNSHVRVVQILIESATELGVVPEVIIDQLEKLNSNEAALLYTVKKKKKRRSGSLTRMFNGFKKIVGALGSSNESLERAEPVPDFDKDAPTPCLTKSAKKRRVNENPFSARKKKDLLSLLPEGSALLPNTSAPPKEKKRISLGVRKEAKLAAAESVPSVMDRRWSLVGAPWHRKKSVDKGDDRLHARLSPVVSLPSLSTPDRHRSFIEEEPGELAKAKSEEIMRDLSPTPEAAHDVSFVQVPRSEYEAIQNRVTAIENKITAEFRASELADDSFVEPVVCGPDSVQEKFVKTLEETTPINSVACTTDQLAKRLSRELKIRRSTECRSPSARKIGTIRRRSRENGARLSRSTTWHMGTTSKNISEKIDSMSKESLCLRSNLKRGRPNTVQTGLRHPSPNRKFGEENRSDDEKWVEAEQFFNDPENEAKEANSEEEARDELPQTPVLKSTLEIFKTPVAPASNSRVGRSMERREHGSITPKYVTSISVNDKTPMAPPPSLPPRRTPQPKKTPCLPPRTPSQLAFAPHAVTPDVQTGRASIARIRSQNAGHVAAKARLFDNLDKSARAGPKNYTSQHSVHGEERLLNRVLKESNQVPRASPRATTPRSRRQSMAIKRHKLLSPISAAKRQRRCDQLLAQRLKAVDEMHKRRRLSEVVGAAPSATTTAGKRANENKTPTKRMKVGAGLVRKSPRLTAQPLRR